MPFSDPATYREYQRLYRQRHAAEIKEYNRVYRAENAQEISKQRKAAYAADPCRFREQKKRDHQKHRKQRLEKNKEQRQLHPEWEQRKKLSPDYFQRNAARWRVWKARNPELARLHKYTATLKRRAAQRAAPNDGTVNSASIKALFLEYEGLCAYCMGSATSVDHIEPLINGGPILF